MYKTKAQWDRINRAVGAVLLIVCSLFMIANLLFTPETATDSTALAGETPPVSVLPPIELSTTPMRIGVDVGGSITVMTYNEYQDYLASGLIPLADLRTCDGQ